MHRSLVDYEQYKGHLLYHMSSVKFDFPSMDEIDKNKDGCDKRILGLWATGKPGLTGFGNFCYEIEMKDDAVLKGLDISSLVKFHFSLDPDDDPIEKYKELRKLFQTEADVVFLLDSNPQIGEVVIVNFDKIKSFKLCKV